MIPVSENERWRIEELQSFHDNLSWHLETLQEYNTVDGIRGRKLAVAITNIEQGLLWLDQAIRTIKSKQPPPN